MKYLYNIIIILFALFSLPVFAFRLLKEQGVAERLRQVFGRLPDEVMAHVAHKNCIWLHAASVGEIVAASPLVKEIHQSMPGIPVLLSVMTPSGYAMARQIIKEADAVIYFPFDLPGIGARVLQSILPRAVVLVETELWPNFLKAAADRKIPIVMVNGRISDKSMRRYRYLGGIVPAMLKDIAKFCMQSPLDAKHIIALGAAPERVIITGNTKFDQTYSGISQEEQKLLMAEVGFSGHSPILLAGSTHKGEEEILFQAFAKIKDCYPGAKMLIAPRELLRAEEIIKLAENNGFSARKRTVPAAIKQDDDIVVLDTIGELGKMYSLGDLVFVGGSLIPHGGHNILEPAIHGKPILVGPHMFNFKQTYALLSERGACIQINDVSQLVDKALFILNNESVKREMGSSAFAVVEENRGAARKSIVCLEEILN